MKSIYFLSDAHLGSWALDHKRMQERRLVRFLDSIKDKAAAVYLLGDMFDFWYEYKYVVPKGYTRFLGKLSELTDMGVEVHYFTGNHDIWAYDYLEKECGVILHKQPQTIELYGKIFYLAHGDGLGDPNKSFKLIRSIFHNKTCPSSAICLVTVASSLPSMAASSAFESLAFCFKSCNSSFMCNRSFTVENYLSSFSSLSIRKSQTMRSAFFLRPAEVVGMPVTLAILRLSFSVGVWRRLRLRRRGSKGGGKIPGGGGGSFLAGIKIILSVLSYCPLNCLI